MKLLSGPLSMFGAKAEVAALEKSIDAEVSFVGFSLEKIYEPKHPDVLRINPKGQIPVLMDGDLEIYDSTQIFEYFEALKPLPALWPADPRSRARARLLEHESDEVFFPNAVQLMPHMRARGAAMDVDEAKNHIHSYYAKMNGILADSDYLAGEFSYADIAFFSAQYFASFLGQPAPDDHARVTDWRKRLWARPSIAAVFGKMSAFLEAQGIPAPKQG
jgi:glutathione S-transferase